MQDSTIIESLTDGNPASVEIQLAKENPPLSEADYSNIEQFLALGFLLLCPNKMYFLKK